MTPRGNNQGDTTIDDPRDIADAAADAVAEHEYWLQAFHKAVICGLPPGDAVIGDDAHLTCRFGRWLAQHRAAGMLDGEPFDELERSHAEIHQAARHLALKVAARDAIAAGEYDSFTDAMNGFRRSALEVEGLHGGVDGNAAVDDDDGLAALESRLTMLNELERERDRAVRTAAPLCLLLVRPQGLAELKAKNGRVGVDRAVIGMATRLFAQLRPYDAVFRYGPAEFLLSLPNTTPDQALVVARRLAGALDEAPFSLSEKVTATLHARFGIAVADARRPVQETLDQAVRAVESIPADAGTDARIAVWSPAPAS